MVKHDHYADEKTIHKSHHQYEAFQFIEGLNVYEQTFPPIPLNDESIERLYPIKKGHEVDGFDVVKYSGPLNISIIIREIGNYINDNHKKG